LKYTGGNTTYLQKIDPIKFVQVLENKACLARNEHGKASGTDGK
jgi:hypothetical protein